MLRATRPLRPAALLLALGALAVPGCSNEPPMSDTAVTTPDPAAKPAPAPAPAPGAEGAASAPAAAPAAAEPKS